jgi:hypothetical protein
VNFSRILPTFFAASAMAAAQHPAFESRDELEALPEGGPYRYAIFDSPVKGSKG